MLTEPALGERASKLQSGRATAGDGFAKGSGLVAGVGFAKRRSGGGAGLSGGLEIGCAVVLGSPVVPRGVGRAVADEGILGEIKELQEQIATF